MDLYRVNTRLDRVDLGPYRVNAGLYRVNTRLDRVEMGLYRVNAGLYRVDMGLFELQGHSRSDLFQIVPENRISASHVENKLLFPLILIK
ncbi:Hypothetical protein NTJ_14955 [Nesidiocoris tenuis]|uniref:Malectin domain-containing protein n=1 Tax=Nesidiocoris tenuis TaxID=355587 RepID=A0ABN7BG75_9HEMI|nr:Hypothetical protein NTJ_14955 [Nesidiocoris tenuis]